MHLKTDIQGWLIYLALGIHGLAFLLGGLRFPRACRLVYGGGFVVVLLAWAYRWVQVGHLPLQNLFEIFLFLGMVFPLTLFSRYVLRVGAERFDILLAMVVLVPAGFVFSSEPQQLPPALQSWLFAPHVAAYMLAYIFMAKAAFQAAAQLAGGKPQEPFVSYEQGTYRLVCVGFPLLTLGLILGSIWGKLAWGDYWNWDPKELWSLASWLMVLIYLHVRIKFKDRHPRRNSLLALLAMAAIIITLLWVNLSRLFPGLHSYATS